VAYRCAVSRSHVAVVNRIPVRLHP
jgi:hypothetical protein